MNRRTILKGIAGAPLLGVAGVVGAAEALASDLPEVTAMQTSCFGNPITGERVYWMARNDLATWTEVKRL